MRKILIALVLVSLISSQQLVLDNYSYGQDVDQVFQKSEWNNEKEIAVYGWFKISSQLSRTTSLSTVFQLSSNAPDKIGTQVNQGDRVLALYMMNNQIVTPTYSVAQQNNNIYTLYNFANADVDQWAFFYVGYGPDSSQQQVYIKLATTTITDLIPKITHTTSSYYYLFLGKTFAKNFFPGDIFKVFIHVGKGAFRTKGFDALQQQNGPSNPNPVSSNPNCVILYTQCNYTGTAISACNGLPNIDVNTIKSIKIPQGSSFTLYGSANYKGKSAKFTTSAPCINTINWKFLFSKQHSAKSSKGHSYLKKTQILI